MFGFTDSGEGNGVELEVEVVDGESALRADVVGWKETLSSEGSRTVYGLEASFGDSVAKASKLCPGSWDPGVQSLCSVPGNLDEVLSTCFRLLLTTLPPSGPGTP